MFSQMQAVRSYATVAPKSVDWAKVQIPLRFTGVKGNLAKALLISAHENNLTDVVRKDLTTLRDNYPDQRYRARINVAAGKPDCPSLKDEFSHPTRILLHELYARKIVKDIPNVARAYDSLVKMINNEIEATVTAAKAEDLTSIEQQIKKSLAAAGKTGNVILTTKVDPQIIGGYVIEFDDFYGDFSVRSFANEYFQRRQKNTASKASSKRGALLKELNSQPHSDSILREKIKSVEEAIYNRYQHLVSDKDIIVDEVPQKSAEAQPVARSIIDTYLNVSTFHP
jgi:F0F1-type ATP synthase delta subunit